MPSDPEVWFSRRQELLLFCIALQLSLNISLLALPVLAPKTGLVGSRSSHPCQNFRLPADPPCLEPCLRGNSPAELQNLSALAQFLLGNGCSAACQSTLHSSSTRLPRPPSLTNLGRVGPNYVTKIAPHGPFNIIRACHDDYCSLHCMLSMGTACILQADQTYNGH